MGRGHSCNLLACRSVVNLAAQFKGWVMGERDVPKYFWCLSKNTMELMEN